MVKKKLQEKSEDKFFKYFLIGFVIIVIVASILINNEPENEEVIINEGDIVMHYFYLETCKFCKVQEEYHKVLLAEYENLKILKYDMSKQSSRDKFIELGTPLGIDTTRISTPTTIIGSEYNVGFLNEEVTGLKLKSMIENELNNTDN